MAESKRMSRYEPSRSVVEILKLAERPEVISFAGGLPDPSVFDLDRVRESMDRVLRDDGAAALNYGPNAGLSKLREWIAERMQSNDDVTATPENVQIVSGGVEGLNLTAMSMLDAGDTVLVEAPTYMVATHVFKTYDATIETVPTDGGGLDPAALEVKLAELEARRARPKLLYVIPSFQNPGGTTMALDRRRKTVEACRRYGVRIVEDHAYAELVYDGERWPSLKMLDPENVILVHTFSKIFGPGVRLGWVVAEPELIARLGLCKLGTDQCPNTLTQHLVYDFGKHGFIDEQVARSIALYRNKRDLTESAMREHFPADAGWEHPTGGFFLWVKLDARVDTRDLLRRAIENQKTAFVAGASFFPAGGGENYLRLSFSFVAEEEIERGIERLATAILEE